MSDLVAQLRLRAPVSHDREYLEAAADALTEALAREAKLRELVEAAFHEGFQEGKDGGWVCGSDIPWKESEVRAALKKEK